MISMWNVQSLPHKAIGSLDKQGSCHLDHLMTCINYHRAHIIIINDLQSYTLLCSFEQLMHYTGYSAALFNLACFLSLFWKIFSISKECVPISHF